MTKTGDSGTTGLLGGSRVSKSSPRLHAYGTVDELNATLGIVLAENGLPEDLRVQITSLQHTLFRLGADLASPLPLTTPRMNAEDVTLLEEWIAPLELSLPPLQNFIVPGGSRSAALLHHARTICRRAERWVVTLAEEDRVNPHTQIYLNRLSDYLFLAARKVNQTSEKKEQKVFYSA